MYVARLICSDVDCAEEREIGARTLSELSAGACECGCALEIVGWPSWVEVGESALVVPVPERPSWSDAA